MKKYNKNKKQKHTNGPKHVKQHVLGHLPMFIIPVICHLCICIVSKNNKKLVKETI